MSIGLAVGLLLSLGILTRCGQVNVGLGPGASPNVPVPSGTPLYQAQFFGQNGKTVTGSAIIYSSGYSYTLRLSGLTAPVENGLQVQVYATPGGKISTLSLQSSTGSQNYPLSGVSPNIVFNQVNIFSTLNNENYGSALF